MIKGHIARGGCLARAFRDSERYRTDKAYRERKKEYGRKWRIENRDELNKRRTEMRIILNEFKNKRCKTCDKLLDHRTKGDYCIKHWFHGNKK